MKKSIVLFVTMIALMACEQKSTETISTTTTTTTPQEEKVISFDVVHGVRWKATAITFDGAGVGITDENAPEFLFKDGKVTGFLGCNNFMCTYTQNQEGLKLDRVMSTKKMCQNEIDIENKTVALLNTTNSFYVYEDSTRMRLISPDGTLECKRKYQ